VSKLRFQYKSNQLFFVLQFSIASQISFIIYKEGKKYTFRKDGIAELNNYDFIEQNYIQKYYPDFQTLRTVVLYGSQEKVLIEIEIGFLLNENKQFLGVYSTACHKKRQVWILQKSLIF